MKKLTLTYVSLVTVLSAAGCSGAGPAGNPPGNGPVGTPIPPTSPASVTTVSVRGFTHAYGGAVLPSVRVCQGAGHAANRPCTTSGSDGSFTLSGVPGSTGVSVFFEKDGFQSVLREIETLESDITLPEGENALLPAATPQAVFGMQAEPSKGHVEFVVLTSSSEVAPNVSVTLGGGDGSSQQPIYLDANGVPAPGASSGSRGGFANVTEGVYVLRFGGPSVNCTPNGLYGYPVTAYQDPASGQAVVMVPVVAGTMTAPVGATCTLK
jgi:hypothetical protein